MGGAPPGPGAQTPPGRLPPDREESLLPSPRPATNWVLGLYFFLFRSGPLKAFVFPSKKPRGAPHFFDCCGLGGLLWPSSSAIPGVKSGKAAIQAQDPAGGGTGEGGPGSFTVISPGGGGGNNHSFFFLTVLHLRLSVKVLSTRDNSPSPKSPASQPVPWASKLYVFPPRCDIGGFGVP